ncbi:hypothetical protein [Cellulomonas sp. Marseille-Q8402]
MNPSVIVSTNAMSTASPLPISCIAKSPTPIVAVSVIAPGRMNPSAAEPPAAAIAPPTAPPMQA